MIPIEFLRQFRLGDYAIFDFIVVFLGFYLLAPLLSKIFLKLGLNIPKKSWLFLALPIGILTHLLFGRITPMTRDFISPESHYMLKIFILALLFLGIKGMTLVKK
jgi:hypothetical protein